MDDSLIKLCKIAKIHYYSDAIKLLKSPKVKNGSFTEEVDVKEYHDEIFSTEDLIDGKYYYYQEFDTNDFCPNYRTRFINTLDISKVKNILLSVIPKKIRKKLKSIDIFTYKSKSGEYIHKADFVTPDGGRYMITESGDNYDNSKIKLFHKIIKFLNHLRYERNKRTSKKE